MSLARHPLQLFLGNEQSFWCEPIIGRNESEPLMSKSFNLILERIEEIKFTLVMGLGMSHLLDTISMSDTLPLITFKG